MSSWHLPTQTVVVEARLIYLTRSLYQNSQHCTEDLQVSKPQAPSTEWKDGQEDPYHMMVIGFLCVYRCPFLCQSQL